jgi:large subunit ribosomal protein L35
MTPCWGHKAPSPEIMTRLLVVRARSIVVAPVSALAGPARVCPRRVGASLPMPKNKQHKGLLKRIRISKTGKVRHRTAGHKHLRSGKGGKRLRRLRKDPLHGQPGREAA